MGNGKQDEYVGQFSHIWEKTAIMISMPLLVYVYMYVSTCLRKEQGVSIGFILMGMC